MWRLNWTDKEFQGVISEVIGQRSMTATDLYDPPFYLPTQSITDVKKEKTLKDKKLFIF